MLCPRERHEYYNYAQNILMFYNVTVAIDIWHHASAKQFSGQILLATGS